jgi:hypothetical protein
MYQIDELNSNFLLSGPSDVKSSKYDVNDPIQSPQSMSDPILLEISTVISCVISFKLLAFPPQGGHGNLQLLQPVHYLTPAACA